MSIGGYKIRNKEEIHFITFAVLQWVDVFTRKAYRDIVVESLRHCQEQKGLLLHRWCIMSNHVHLLASAENNLSDILRDFKKFTSKQLVAAIRRTSTKAGENGCSPSFSSAERLMAETHPINSGSKTTGRKNASARLLLCRSSITSIVTR